MWDWMWSCMRTELTFFFFWSEKNSTFHFNDFSNHFFVIPPPFLRIPSGLRWYFSCLWIRRRYLNSIQITAASTVFFHLFCFFFICWTMAFFPTISKMDFFLKKTIVSGTHWNHSQSNAFCTWHAFLFIPFCSRRLLSNSHCYWVDHRFYSRLTPP